MNLHLEEAFKQSGRVLLLSAKKVIKERVKQIKEPVIIALMLSLLTASVVVFRGKEQNCAFMFLCL